MESSNIFINTYNKLTNLTNKIDGILPFCNKISNAISSSNALNAIKNNVYVKQLENLIRPNAKIILITIGSIVLLIGLQGFLVGLGDFVNSFKYLDSIYTKYLNINGKTMFTENLITVIKYLLFLILGLRLISLKNTSISALAGLILINVILIVFAVLGLKMTASVSFLVMLISLLVQIMALGFLINYFNASNTTQSTIADPKTETNTNTPTDIPQ